MYADENAIFGGIRNPCADFQRHEDIAIARHFYIETCRFQQRLQIASDIESEILLSPITADRSPIETAMARIKHDGFYLPESFDHLRPQLRFDGLGQIDTGDEIFAILLRHRKTKPVAHAINDDLAAVEHYFDFVLAAIESDSLCDRLDADRQSVKLCDVIDRQIIPAAHLDDLPVGTRECALGDANQSNSKTADELLPGEHASGYSGLFCAIW